MYLPDVTIGVMLVEGKFVCFSIELPWRENERNISCIPEGDYFANWEPSKKFQHGVFRLEKVEGRDGILIHVANRTNEIRGCIAPNSYLDGLNGIKGLHSAQAQKTLIQLFGRQGRVKITIQSVSNAAALPF